MSRGIQTAAAKSLEAKSTDANAVKLRLNNGNTIYCEIFNNGSECDFSQMYTVYYPTKRPIRNEAEDVRIPTWK